MSSPESTSSRSIRWLNPDQVRPTLILLSATALMLAWRYFGSAEFAETHLRGWLAATGNATFASGAYGMLTCFVLMGLAPVLMVVFVFRQPLGIYGIQLGDRLKTVRSALLSVPAFVLAAYIASNDPAVTVDYPLNQAAGDSAAAFALHAAVYLLYYFGWEFTFRGYLLFGLADRFGVAAAIMVQAMASSLLHIGKPPIETFLAIPVGIYWGWIAIRTRSIGSTFIQHATLGITLDAFIIWRVL